MRQHRNECFREYKPLSKQKTLNWKQECFGDRYITQNRLWLLNEVTKYGVPYDEAREMSTHALSYYLEKLYTKSLQNSQNS